MERVLVAKILLQWLQKKALSWQSKIHSQSVVTVYCFKGFVRPNWIEAHFSHPPLFSECEWSFDCGAHVN